jgi:1-acyl-sn-glycerol-3-phosphate acyltransferase
MTPVPPPTLRAAARFDPQPEKRLSVRVLRAANRIFFRTYHRLTVYSPPQIPARRAAILICNHTSGLDPFLLQTACNRVIIWMMAKEYYEIRPLRPFFEAVEAIPVDRAARDVTAMRLALRALQDGRVLGIFPEGRISAIRGQLLPFQPGVAQMAIKTGVPVYPAFLDGTQYGVASMGAAFASRQEATLRFGPAVEFDRSSTARPVLDAATVKMQAAIESLRGKRPVFLPATK